MPEFHLDTSGWVAGREWRGLDAVTQGYLEAAFFTNVGTWEKATIAADPAGFKDALQRGSTDGSLPADSGFADLAPEALQEAVEDCAKFQASPAWGAVRLNRVWAPLAQMPDLDAHAGRDFWYTRNGHECGFWDGDWPEPYATALTDAADAFGEVDVYLGDDGKVYFS